MLNRIFLMGRLARDPELRRTQTGTPVASFRLAVDRDFKDNNTGERATDWIDVVAWRQTAEFVSRYFTKGRMAVVEGRLQIRDWTDKEGNKRTTAEVVADQVYFGDSKRDSDPPAATRAEDMVPPAAIPPPPRPRHPPALAPPRAATSLPSSLTTTASCRFNLEPNMVVKGGFSHGYGT